MKKNKLNTNLYFIIQIYFKRAKLHPLQWLLILHLKRFDFLECLCDDTKLKYDLYNKMFHMEYIQVGGLNNNEAMVHPSMTYVPMCQS